MFESRVAALPLYLVVAFAVAALPLSLVEEPSKFLHTAALHKALSGQISSAAASSSTTVPVTRKDQLTNCKVGSR